MQIKALHGKCLLQQKLIEIHFNLNSTMTHAFIMLNLKNYKQFKKYFLRVSISMFTRLVKFISCIKRKFMLASQGWYSQNVGFLSGI